MNDAGQFTPILERIAGALLVCIAAPAVLLSAAAIYALSGRSPFIAHLRVGRYGRPLWMWKLRTMWAAGPASPRERGFVERIIAEPSTEKSPDDRRVTSRFAAFCRRHSIDELVQLLHVARGEMSLVGPRPLTRSEIDRHYAEVAPDLLAARPGLTGLWQLEGRNLLDWQTRVKLDLESARVRTFGQTLILVCRTVPELVRGRGAW